MEVIEKEHLIRPANQRWKLLCAMIGHVKYTQSKAGFCKEINNAQFIFSEPIVEIQVATKIPLVSWFKGTPIPHVCIATDREQFESTQFQVCF